MNRESIKHPFRIAITGHRFWPNFNEEKGRFFDSMDKLVYALESMNIPAEKMVFLQGCASGVDMWFGEFARRCGINYELYLPFPRPIQISRAKYIKGEIEELNLQFSESPVKVINQTFFTYGYQKRNIALVEDSHLLLTYFTRSRSGSGNCANYAKKVSRWIVDLKRISEKVDVLPFNFHDVLDILEEV